MKGSDPTHPAGGTFEFLRPTALAALSARALSVYQGRAFRYWRKRGFPYPELSDAEIDARYRSFVRSTHDVFVSRREIGWSPLGIGLANHFQPHMWRVECQYFRSPFQVFHDDELFRQCIERSIRINRDRSPLSPNNMRVMLSTFRNTKRVSNFRPTVARALYQRYSQDGDLVVDPSAGFGGRLLGALPLERTYIGIEPNRRSASGMRTMMAKLADCRMTRASATILEGRSEVLLKSLPSRSAALVINSPPYFSRERYSDDDSQSWVCYPAYEDWKKHFLESQMREVHRILKRGGFYCLNVENTETSPVADDAFRIARRFFRPYYRYRLLIGSVPYHRNGQCGGHRSEPLVVYQKVR